MRDWKLISAVAIIALSGLLAACGSGKPDKVTVDGYDAELVVFDESSGQAVRTQIGTVPAGATCDCVDAWSGAGEAWVSVKNCTLAGQDYGSGLIPVESCKERDQLYSYIKAGQR